MTASVDLKIRIPQIWSCVRCVEWSRGQPTDQRFTHCDLWHALIAGHVVYYHKIIALIGRNDLFTVVYLSTVRRTNGCTERASGPKMPAVYIVRLVGIVVGFPLDLSLMLLGTTMIIYDWIVTVPFAVVGPHSWPYTSLASRSIALNGWSVVVRPTSPSAARPVRLALIFSSCYTPWIHHPPQNTHISMRMYRFTAPRIAPMFGTTQDTSRKRLEWSTKTWLDDKRRRKPLTGLTGGYRMNELSTLCSTTQILSFFIFLFLSMGSYQWRYSVPFLFFPNQNKIAKSYKFHKNTRRFERTEQICSLHSKFYKEL